MRIAIVAAVAGSVAFLVGAYLLDPSLALMLGGGAVAAWGLFTDEVSR